MADRAAGICSTKGTLRIRFNPAAEVAFVLRTDLIRYSVTCSTGCLERDQSKASTILAFTTTFAFATASWRGLQGRTSLRAPCEQSTHLQQAAPHAAEGRGHRRLCVERGMLQGGPRANVAQRLDRPMLARLSVPIHEDRSSYRHISSLGVIPTSPMTPRCTVAACNSIVVLRSKGTYSGRKGRFGITF
jgi:hypothetical protein